MQGQGLSERRALRVVRMSASALRYEARPDRNGELREKIVRLAQRHRRYGAGMIYLKLRQGGERVNHKRVERLYALEAPQIRRRRRKKIPVSERQPLVRPARANEVWSMDFVFCWTLMLWSTVTADRPDPRRLRVATDRSAIGRRCCCLRTLEGLS